MLQKENTETFTAGYSQSAGLVSLLAHHNISIAFTSYQSGILYMLGRNWEGGAHLHQCAIPSPMGLHYAEQSGLTLSAGFQIMRFENPLAKQERINHKFDVCFVPRHVYFTGTLDAHDIGLAANGQPVFVNTRFNCLAAPDSRHSFRPIWMPPFINAIVDEDRCHLNGLAMSKGQPAYVTAVSRSNTIDGWRDRRTNGGVLIDVESNRIVCEGLSMPHSPRIHNGRLWLLNAGTGELGTVDNLDTENAQFVPRTFCPGFLRGLALFENFAVVGLSKPRHQRFEGLALDRRLTDTDSEPWCGIQVIDINTGHCVEWFRIDGDVTELYDVAVIPGAVCPMTVSPNSAEITQFITWQKDVALA